VATTLRGIIANCRNVANGGRTDRAHTYSDRTVKRWITYWRAFLLKNDIKKKGYVDVGYEQDLGCLTLTKADQALCSKYNWGENVFYVELPELLDLPDNMGLTFFGLIDKQTRIVVSDYSYGSYNKYKSFVPKTAIYGEKIDNTIFVHNINQLFPLSVVSARGVMADPANLCTCSAPGNPLQCFDWDKDCYPIPPGLESTLYDFILQKEVGIARFNKQMGLPDMEDNEATKAPL